MSEQFKSIETTELIKIANAIRVKTGNNEQIALKDMPDKIRSIEGGGDTVEVENLDTTLTKEGYAADAKAVGDALEGKQPIGDYVLANKLPAWAKKPNPPTPAEIGAAPAYTYGTADIEAGTASPYPEGTLHFIYEPAG